MKARMSIKNIITVMATICFASMFFINICFATNTGKISTETARLREQPQTDAKVLELVSLGEEVEILDEADGWYKVKYNKITGYIRVDLIEVKNKEENTESTGTESTELETTETESESAGTENTEIENVTTENTNNETNTDSVEETTTIEKGKYKISENVKLKIIPLISAIELDEVSKDAEVEVTEVLNNWSKIKTAEGKEGWIRVEKLENNQKENDQEQQATTENNQQENNQQENNQQENNQQENNQEQSTTTDTTTNSQNTTKTMYVNSQTINVRQKADKTSKVIKQLTVNTQVTVLSTENGWSYVDIGGTKGYIAENLLSSTKQETSRSAMTQRSTTSASTTADTQTSENTTQTANKTETKANTTTSTTGSSVVSYAKQFLGCKYVYGGTTTSGFDCSGFTQFVYKHFGISLNRTAAAQYSNGKQVTNLQVGDLVMFGKSGINHVGIYIGGNTFIHAANPSRGVTTDTLSSGYYKTNYVGARRVI